MPANPTTQTKSKRRAAAIVTQGDAIRDKAAILFANDEMRPEGQRKRSDQSIAEELGISRASITRWKREPEFRAMIQDARSAIRSEALRLPIADKMWRVKVLNDSVMADLDAIRLRAETYAKRAGTPEEAARNMFGSTTPPWAATGKFVEQPKISANGTVVTEWAYDKAIESSINEKLKQAAQELGQLVDKREETRHIEVRMVAQRIAEETGMNESEVLAEAERIVAMAGAE